jgi:hypothetical protein
MGYKNGPFCGGVKVCRFGPFYLHMTLYFGLRSFRSTLRPSKIPFKPLNNTLTSKQTIKQTIKQYDPRCKGNHAKLSSKLSSKITSSINSSSINTPINNITTYTTIITPTRQLSRHFSTILNHNSSFWNTKRR